jgi:helicase MOV-10
MTRHSGDTIMVQRAQPSDGRWYEGIVHLLEQEHVGLLFAQNFQWSPAERYDIKFVFNRFPLRRQHQALHCSFAENRILFPWPDQVKRGPPLPNQLQLYNTSIASNDEQYLAVKTISHLPAGAHAFLVFGP